MCFIKSFVLDFEFFPIISYDSKKKNKKKEESLPANLTFFWADTLNKELFFLPKDTFF